MVPAVASESTSPNNQRFMEVIAVLSTVAPGVLVTNVGIRYVDGTMWVIVPKEKARG